MTASLPDWASQMCDLFKSGSVSQFILHGNVFDTVSAQGASLREFLVDNIFTGFDVVLHYDRGRGIRALRGAKDWGTWFEESSGLDPRNIMAIRESGKALELIDRYLLRSLNLQAVDSTGSAPRKIAVLIDFAEFVVPMGESLQLGGEFSANVVKVLSWANDPVILRSNIATVLITEGLHDLNELVVENPHSAKIKIPLPTEAEMLEYLTAMAATMPGIAKSSEVGIDVLARRLTGLSRTGARTSLSLTLQKGQKITSQQLSRMKKDMIERECQGLLEFIESPFTLDNVAGHEAVKQWLRDDASLLQKGAFHALPMGYLIAGRIGTGKTFLVQCWAGELGLPCLVFKNFRDKWVGATESNLEKIFSILRAIGQVIVFVDEADQAAGKREGGDGDSGLSGRVYAMLAKEMSDTRNRGKIVWVFATSRPDLLEVDLKRQGRLDVHIPLFAPQTAKEVRELLKAVASKLKFPLQDKDLPELQDNATFGGNEIEGVLVRSLRTFELCPEPRRPLKDIMAETLKEVRPSAQSRKLEYMDLVAVRECTDERFLPEMFRTLTPEEIERRIDELRRFI
jgi:hypothetical protein